MHPVIPTRGGEQIGGVRFDLEEFKSRAVRAVSSTRNFIPPANFVKDLPRWPGTPAGGVFESLPDGLMRVGARGEVE